MADLNKIFTRLQLKYDTLANWQAVKDTFTPLAGEVCITKIEVNDPANKMLEPIMIKVGDGEKTWGQLDWISAKAADVYSWAKKAGIEVTVEYADDIPSYTNKEEFPIIDLDFDTSGDKVVLKAKKGYIPADSVWFEGNGSGAIATGSLENIITPMQYDILANEEAIGRIVNATKDADGSAVFKLIAEPDENDLNIVHYSTEKVDIAITHDQVTDFDTAVDTRIDALIAASDPDQDGNVITNIQNLVEYVENNAGEIAQLVTDVGTANTDAANAVTTANSAAETAGQALEKANEALTGATGAAASAAAAKTSEDNAKASENAAAGSASAAAASEQAAGQAKLGAETAKGLAEEARDAAIEAKNGADTAKGLADEAKNAAVTAQGKAEAAQSAAEGFASDADSAKTAAEAAQEAAEAAKNAALDANTSATAIANEAKNTADAAKEASDAATEAVAGLHAIATSGSIYDVAEGSNVSKGTDTNVKYLVFNCGTASTVI